MAGCAHILHLERRPAGFHFRRRVPARFRGGEKKFAISFLSFSLRTHVPAEAKAIARGLTALSDRAFDLMSEREMQQFGADEMALLTGLARFQIAAHEAARAMAGPRSEEAARFAAACERATQEALGRALALGDREPVREALRATAAALGVTLDETTADWRRLAHEALKVMLDVSRERERRECGQYEGPTIFFRSAMGHQPTGPAPAESPRPVAWAVPATASPPVPLLRALPLASGASQQMAARRVSIFPLSIRSSHLVCAAGRPRATGARRPRRLGEQGGTGPTV